METIVPHPGQHLAQQIGTGPAGILGLRQRFQEGGDLCFVGVVGEAGGRTRLLGFVLGFVGHAGCHQRPASTTPAESSRLDPIMRSPIESA